ncbi:MAG: lactate racemase domain-containing protein [Desulfobacterales bacterium]
MRIQLPELPWYGNTMLEIDLPDHWEVEHCPMRGSRRPLLTGQQMAAAIRDPIQSPPIRELAEGKKTATIVFDDMTRPTRTFELVPIVLKDLHDAGIRAENITFVCALGAHGALPQNALRKKLGRQILENYRVFNHNPYENCVYLGTTSYGTPVMINREVMEADVKIGIGCVTAHARTGFSGGGKLLLPGVAHIDSISHFHIDVASRAPETTGLGRYENNILRQNIEQAAAMAEMDFKIDVIVNDRGATTAVFAGKMESVHERAVALAKDVYATDPRPRDKDLVIANAFAKANEMTIAVAMGIGALADKSKTLVVIANCPEGQVVHYLLGRFGRNYGGRRYPVATVPEGLKLVIQAPYMDKTFADWFSNPETVAWSSSWQQTLEILKPISGAHLRAAVIPNATMQYYDH